MVHFSIKALALSAVFAAAAPQLRAQDAPPAMPTPPAEARAGSDSSKAPAAPRRRYAELASNLMDAWSTVRSIRESNVPPQVTVEVHVPAAVLQRLNQTKELAENLTESWSTFQSKHSH